MYPASIWFWPREVVLPSFSLLASAWSVLVLVYNQDLGLTRILLAVREETASEKLEDTPALDIKAIEYLNSVEELVSDTTEALGNI